MSKETDNKAKELIDKGLRTYHQLIHTAVENPGMCCSADEIPVMIDDKPELFITITYIGEEII